MKRLHESSWHSFADAWLMKLGKKPLIRNKRESKGEEEREEVDFTVLHAGVTFSHRDLKPTGSF